MRALNEKESIRLNVKFGIHMVVLVVVTLFFVFSFKKTSEAEISEINLKSGDSENIYYAQMELIEDIDDLLSRYKSFDMVEEVNAEFLMRSIVDRKMEIQKKISKLPEDDVKIFSFMMSKIDGLLRFRDSISAVKDEEYRVKKDFLLCTGDYKKMSNDILSKSFFNK